MMPPYAVGKKAILEKKTLVTHHFGDGKLLLSFFSFLGRNNFRKKSLWLSSQRDAGVVSFWRENRFFFSVSQIFWRENSFFLCFANWEKKENCFGIQRSNFWAVCLKSHQHSEFAIVSKDRLLRSVRNEQLLAIYEVNRDNNRLQAC